MSECGFLEICKFMNETMQDKEALAAVLKQKYCIGMSEECARLTVCRELGGPEHVPVDLWPNDAAGASQLIIRATPQAVY